MRSVKFTMFVFFIFLIANQSFGLGSQIKQQNLSIIEDSLVIQKDDLQKQFVIYSGNKIELWLDNKSTVKGQFLSFDGFVITMKKGDLTLKIPIFKIDKIKRYGDKGAQIMGTTIIVLGVAAMVASISAVSVGLILIATGTLTGPSITSFLAGSILLGGIGYATYRGGDAIIGKKVNLKRGWTILQPQ